MAKLQGVSKEVNDKSLIADRRDATEIFSDNEIFEAIVSGWRLNYLDIFLNTPQTSHRELTSEEVTKLMEGLEVTEPTLQATRNNNYWSQIQPTNFFCMNCGAKTVFATKWGTEYDEVDLDGYCCSTCSHTWSTGGDPEPQYLILRTKLP